MHTLPMNALPKAADTEESSGKKVSAKEALLARMAARRAVAKGDKGNKTGSKVAAPTRKRKPRTVVKIGPVGAFDSSRAASIQELSDKRGTAVSEKALKVGLLLAAIDGHCDENEIQKFKLTAKSCGGLSEAKISQIVSQTKRRIAILEALAKSGAADAEVVDRFIEEARKIGIEGDCRNFVLWLSIAMVDGDYSAVERQAVQRLQQDVNGRASFLASVSTFRGCNRHDISDVFLKRCELILRGLYDSDARGDKELVENRMASLQKLIETAEI